jgi:serine/threonine protein kinase
MFADPGRMLGKYQLIAEIARGGMGVVYLALVRGPGDFHKLVVIKELKPELVEESAYLTMFLDEARLAARLSHPNIVQTNEVGHEADRYFMAMDYLDGRGLDHVRRRSRSAGFGLTLHMHLRVISDVLAGLDYAHKLADFDGTPLHVVHRDVSPQNVFLTFDGQIKLLDFGIAKAADSKHETKAGVVKGKISYMSPEQGRGEKVDARADVFSVGVMMWEALTGRRLRDGKDEQEKLWALVCEDVPRASQIKPVPHELDEICARAMAWDRERRYATAAEMQHDLERYLADAGSHVTARDVGLCVSELFRDDRATTNAVIEAHVARARGGAVREQLPVIDVARTSAASSSSSLAKARTESSLSARARAPQPVPQAVVERPRRPRWVWLVAGGAVVVGAVGVIAATAPRDVKPIVHAVIEPVAPPPRPAVRPVEPAPTAVALEIRVSPDGATISIDGKPVEGNPYLGRFATDNLVHHIRATAPGFLPKSRAVSFLNNVTLDLSLERAEAPAPPVRPRPGRKAEPTSPPPAPAVGSDKRPIDLTNPYGGAP